MSQNLINSIRLFKNNLDKFKTHNIDTKFGLHIVDKFEDRRIYYIKYKLMRHNVIFHRGLLIPQSYIGIAEQYFELEEKYNDILHQKLSSDNFSQIRTCIKEIVKLIAKNESDYSLFSYDKLDFFFYLCLNAEFHRQAKKNSNLYKLIKPDSLNIKYSNYLGNLIKKNLETKLTKLTKQIQ